MDPSKTLADIRAIYPATLNGMDIDEMCCLFDELRGLMQDLDDWLTTGGFLPDGWDHSNRNTPPVTR